MRPIGLSRETAAVLLVVEQDVQHGLALPSEPPVELVHVAQDVEQGTTPLLRLAHAQLEALHPGEQPRLVVDEMLGARLGRRVELEAHARLRSAFARSSC